MGIQRIVFGMTLLLSFLGAQQQAFAQVFSLADKIVAPDRQRGDRAGYAVAFDSVFLAVSSANDDQDENWTNTMTDAGSVNIYRLNKNQSDLTFVQKIVAPDRSAYGIFGRSVSISGEYLAVGAIGNSYDAQGKNNIPGAGAVYIYRLVKTSGKWVFHQKVTSSTRSASAYFGSSVSLSRNYLLCGAGYESNQAGQGNQSLAGAAYVFKKNSKDQWLLENRFVCPDKNEGQLFGERLDLHHDQALISALSYDDSLAFNRGRTYFYKRQKNGNWKLIQRIDAPIPNRSRLFGTSVALHDSVAVIGATDEDKNQHEKDSIDNAGAAYVYQLGSDGLWKYRQKIVAPDREFEDGFGYSVATDGELIVVGEPKYTGISLKPYLPGTIYLFTPSKSGKWRFRQQISPDDAQTADHFGTAIEINDGNLIVGAHDHGLNKNGKALVDYAGAVYYFEPCRDSTRTIVASACDSFELPTGAGTVYTSGTYSDTLVTPNGCLEVLHVELSLYQSSSQEVELSFCDSFILPGSNKTIRTPGSYSDTLRSHHGCDSIIDFVLDYGHRSVLVDTTICDTILSVSSKYKYYHTGTYFDTIPVTNGCDTRVTTNVTLTPIDPSLWVLNDTIWCMEQNAHYQWINCKTNQTIDSSSLSFLAPNESGMFQVIVRRNGCTDTSNCISFTHSAVFTDHEALTTFLLSSPQSHQVTLKTSSEKVLLEVFSVDGLRLHSQEYHTEGPVAYYFRPGVYLVTIRSKTGNTLFRIVKTGSY